MCAPLLTEAKSGEAQPSSEKRVVPDKDGSNEKKEQTRKKTKLTTFKFRSSGHRESMDQLKDDMHTPLAKRHQVNLTELSVSETVRKPLMNSEVR